MVDGKEIRMNNIIDITKQLLSTWMENSQVPRAGTRAKTSCMFEKVIS